MGSREMIAPVALLAIVALASIHFVTGFVSSPRLTPNITAKLPLSVELDATTCYQNRRHILRGLLFGSIITKQSFAVAEVTLSTTQASTTPFASLDALLPAARVKRVIDRSVTAASEMVEDASNSALPSQALVQELQDLLLKPQNYTRSSQLAASVIPKQPAKQYLESYKNNIDQLNILKKPGGLLVQNGEIDTWKQLKRQERVREGEDEIRAAFNIYTNNLSFSGNSYRLNVPKEERSRMIRQDELPDVKSVIGSDMGMRYLYRNAVLTDMDDARAELRYQLQQGKAFDATELLDILKNAQTSCNSWFSLIDESDVRNALDTVGREETGKSS